MSNFIETAERLLNFLHNKKVRSILMICVGVLMVIVMLWSMIPKGENTDPPSVNGDVEVMDGIEVVHSYAMSETQSCSYFQYSQPWEAVFATEDSCLLIATLNDNVGVAWVNFPMQIDALTRAETMQTRHVYIPEVNNQRWYCEVQTTNWTYICVTEGASLLRTRIDHGW